jgi:hypothetical protein
LEQLLVHLVQVVLQELTVAREQVGKMVHQDLQDPVVNQDLQDPVAHLVRVDLVVLLE